jgi:pyridinium-3,5-biscarboxylic acid mononucleotide sulfurtransferase
MITPLESELDQKYRRLSAIFTEMGSAIVAMSGGVDSVLLAKVAFDSLGELALAVTADSPSLPRRELRQAGELARQIGIRHELVKTDEINDPRYAANPLDRCYFCKDETFHVIDTLAEQLGYRWVCYGENIDDQGDHRPGATAAQEHHVRAPLKEAGLHKQEIRTLARHFDLPVWDKPASACLASRFPYGSPITLEKLSQVEAAEDVLLELGFRQFRVRHHGDVARIEVEPGDMLRLLELSAPVVERLRKIGFTHVAMDLSGYRRGSMNEGLITIESL